MNNLIQQLKDNKKPFGLMSEEMQAEAKDISIVKFDYYSGQNDGAWDVHNKDNFFRHYRTYRLCSDYLADEPKIIERKITIGGCTAWMDKLVYTDEKVLEHGICEASVDPDWMGFLFADGIVKGSPVKYSVPGITSHGYWASYEDLKTGQAREHHATHVLFRRKKQE